MVRRFQFSFVCIFTFPLPFIIYYRVLEDGPAYPWFMVLQSVTGQWVMSRWFAWHCAPLGGKCIGISIKVSPAVLGNKMGL